MSSSKPILYTFPNKDILSQSLADFVIKVRRCIAPSLLLARPCT